MEQSLSGRQTSQKKIARRTVDTGKRRLSPDVPRPAPRPPAPDVPPPRPTAPDVPRPATTD